jgi:hypothetical protein
VRWLFPLFALALSTGCTGRFAPGAAIARYANPVIDDNFPDPAVLHAADGFYYVYATQGAAIENSRSMVRALGYEQQTGRVKA